MKRAVLLAMGGVLLAGAVGGGVSLALFSDAASKQAEVTAGTVALYGERDDGDTVDGPMFYITAEAGTSDGGELGKKATGFWAPGDVMTRTFVVENIGTLDAQIKSVSADITGDEELARALGVRVCNTRSCSDEVYVEETLWDLSQASGEFSPPFELQVFDSPTLFFEVTLPTSAGNDLQGKSVVADFEVYAEQLRNNP